MFTVKIESLAVAKALAMWGTYGKSGWEHCKGRCPLHQYKEVRLVDCTTEHLQTLLTNDWVDGDYETIIEPILDDRGEPYELPEPEPQYVIEYRVHNGEVQFRNRRLF